MKYTKDKTIRLFESFTEKGDPNGWFDQFYSGAEGDINNVYWADLAPNPVLVTWLEKHPPATGCKGGHGGVWPWG